MATLNAIFRAICDLLMAPFTRLDPLVSLTLLSLILGVLLLLVFKWTTDQDKLAEVKRRIHASLFEIRLFNDNLRFIGRAQLDILRHNLSYVRLLVLPLVLMMALLGPAFAVLHYYYGYNALTPGDTTLLEVTLGEEWSGERPAVELEVPDGLVVEVGPVWVPTLRELTWRFRAETEGEYDVTLHLDGGEVTKSVRVGGGLERVSLVRPKGVIDQMTYPIEPPVPADIPIQSISVNYPVATIAGMESEWAWIIIFLVLSVVFALAFRKPLGVTI